MPINTNKIQKILAMVGSSFDGERAAAGALLAKIAAEHRLSIPELVARALHAPAQPAAPSRSPFEFEDAGTDEAELVAKLLRIITQRPSSLNSWELSFAASIAKNYRRRRTLSRKQRAVAQGIIEKFEEAARGCS